MPGYETSVAALQDPPPPREHCTYKVQACASQRRPPVACCCHVLACSCTRRSAPVGSRESQDFRTQFICHCSNVLTLYAMGTLSPRLNPNKHSKSVAAMSTAPCSQNVSARQMHVCGALRPYASVVGCCGERSHWNVCTDGFSLWCLTCPSQNVAPAQSAGCRDLANQRVARLTAMQGMCIKQRADIW